jgi:hypothetical protein
MKIETYTKIFLWVLLIFGGGLLLLSIPNNGHPEDILTTELAVTLNALFIAFFGVPLFAIICVRKRWVDSEFILKATGGWLIVTGWILLLVASFIFG